MYDVNANINKPINNQVADEAEEKLRKRKERLEQWKRERAAKDAENSAQTVDSSAQVEPVNTGIILLI